VVVRLAAPGLAALALASWLAGAGGLASLVLLGAIVAAAVHLLMVVGDAVEGHGDRRPVVFSVAGIVCLVAAGAVNLRLLVLGLLACSVLELLDTSKAPAEPASEPIGPLEDPVSRAA
jgi:hypothetical protein